MTLRVEPSDQACGARVSGLDLSKPIPAELAAEIREVWLEHKVLAFPDQHLDDDALERFTLAMGGFGEDPFFEPISGREHIAAIQREAEETSPLFAENWHSDWSFLERPPAGTCLMAFDIPPRGGDTLFADQQSAFAALPDDRKDELRKLTAIHSAQLAYAPEGTYGEKDAGRSMAIRPSEAARDCRTHPLIRKHPETGIEGFFSTLGYIIGIEGMEQAEAIALLAELAQWQSRDEFVYRHQWEDGMLVMWDNRAVLHKATGGYEGYRRELHRTTIAAWNG
ncbi:TauD/TfdA family dioxygenase [Qipengyuania sp. 1XM1-15A]|uniref:TauD/TfdA dioxygenase family protein n=1 Tax=Qipengyuania xiamenensis TaxID=2867237 RepID=UPI001C87F9EE|nr:TauD/TfdA family dioxygenase [Qipengyuania xiamenensis]MBX7531565.1 TauD/TfdA family dioxygenase [Qipengyuania xiamenensis]